MEKGGWCLEIKTPSFLMPDKLIIPAIPDWNDICDDIKNIYESKNLTTGEWVEKVEKKICELHGCKYALLTGSGSLAFLLLLKSLPKQFDKVYMQDFTWNSTKILIEWLYPGKVEYIDVNKETWLAEEPDFEESLFIPNMTFGNVKSYKYPYTIYDSAHCGGLKECNGRGFGEIISFSPAKATTGIEGGALITNNEEIYNKAKILRRFLARITEINARVLYENLLKIENRLKEKKEIYEKYKKNLSDLYTLQKIDGRSTYNEIGLIVKNKRDDFIDKLKEIFDIRLRYEPNSKLTQNTNYLYNHIIIVPSSPGHDIDRYIEVLNKIAEDQNVCN